MRGWGPESFRRAKPEFMDAVRWGLFVEKVTPILRGYREIQAVPVTKDTPDLPAILGQKNEAARLIPLLEDLIYPKDDDG